MATTIVGFTLLAVPTKATGAGLPAVREDRVLGAMWRFRPSVLLGALWAALAAVAVRRELRTKGMSARGPRPPRLGRRAGLGVTGALNRLSPTCLERALVLQAWLAAQGTLRDVVIGLPPDGMRSQPAHAWVDGTDSRSAATYLELHRLPPPARTRPTG